MLPIKYISSGRSHQGSLLPVYSHFPCIFPSLVIIPVKVIDNIFFSMLVVISVKVIDSIFFSMLVVISVKVIDSIFFSMLVITSVKVIDSISIPYVGLYPSKGKWR